MRSHRRFHVGCRAPEECEVDRRALLLWPRLDRRALSRCRHSLTCVAGLVGRRTGLPPVTVQVLLGARPPSTTELETWFG
jgi:hypothetical protein